MARFNFNSGDNTPMIPATETQSPNGFRLDKSAWISAACFALGAVLAGPSTLLADGKQVAALLAASGAFFIITIIAQQELHVDLSAKSYGKPRILTTTGLFEYSRNPIYLAFLLPLAALAVTSLAASIIATAAYLVVMTFIVIPEEEEILLSRFGQAFIDYKIHTRRWI